MSAPVKRLLTIGHSYVVALNRRLAHEMAIAGEGVWEVTAAAPACLQGDLRHIVLEPIPGERCGLVPLPVHAGRWPHLRSYGGLRALMRQPWDVVHCWEEPYVAAGWQVARRVPASARLVFATFQNLRKQYPPPFNWMERATVRRADGWIGFGHTAHATHVNVPGYAALPSAIIHPGVDVERFAPDASARARVRQAWGWEGGPPVVGYLGRFVPEKGLGVLVEALSRVQRPWRAVFVGGGAELPMLKALASRHPGRVRIELDVAHEQVPDYLNATDLLCAPSQTTAVWKEQFGRMLIESMACGVPVAASTSGEIPHVVGASGLLLPEGDIDAWARAIDDLLGNDGRRTALGAAARARAVSTFSWPAVAERHLEFFGRICAA